MFFSKKIRGKIRVFFRDFFRVFFRDFFRVFFRDFFRVFFHKTDKPPNTPKLPTNFNVFVQNGCSTETEWLNGN